MATFGYVRVGTARGRRRRAKAWTCSAPSSATSSCTASSGSDVRRSRCFRFGAVGLGNRPQGKTLLGRRKAGDVVITPKLDRIFRRALEALGVLADLKDRGISLHMIDLGGDVTGNGISKLVFTILFAVAEAERDRTRGRYLGGVPPFGWRDGDTDELVAVARATGGFDTDAQPGSKRRLASCDR
jgi:putative DNA-invertase from lambdoid prophage Rac